VRRGVGAARGAQPGDRTIRRPQEEQMNVSSVGSTAPMRPAGAPRGGGHEKTMKAVADELGMSTDDLKSALKSGSTMADLAKTAGVSQDDLVKTIASTLPATGPDGATVDTTAMATNIANGVRPQRPAQASGSGADADLGQGIDALSSALGISSSDLLDRLTSGSGITDLLSGNQQVSSQLAALQNKGALVDGYA
jgi:DNA-binding phage protein